MSLRDEPATPSQVRAITHLCAGLGIKEALEEKKMTRGEAGMLVRELSTKMKVVRKTGKKLQPRYDPTKGRRN